jgi:hypothetical protein
MIDWPLFDHQKVDHSVYEFVFEIEIESLFRSVVDVIFQSIFHLEMHQNNIFFIFKILFLILAH